MKTFVWRLQKLLDVKEKEEQFRQTELFRLTEELAARRGGLLVRQRALRDLMAEVARCDSPRRSQSQEFFLRHAAGDDEQIRALREQIAELEVRQKDKMAELLAVRRFKEGLERLRTQAREEFLREQDRLEQKELDDRTTTTFARRAMAGRPDDAQS